VKFLASIAATAALMAGPASAADPAHPTRTLADATRLSVFGERPAFSPDGKRLAFVGKKFGDAYEIDFRTKSIRNLTSGFPHEGILRVQYLPNGDYLIVAPRGRKDDASRFNVELWVLDKELKHGLQPLDQPSVEGVAISRTRNLISWTEKSDDWTPPRIENGRYIVPEPRRGSLIIKVGEIMYEKGLPRLINRREVIRGTLPACVGESQDFFRNDTQLTITCANVPKEGGATGEVWSVDIATGKATVLTADPTRYNEVEGIAPDETWTLVECGRRTSDVGRVPPLDLCRLDLRPGGEIRPLIHTPRPSTPGAPGSTAGTTNGVVSPDGHWVAFQAADNRNETGVGLGVYIVRIDDSIMAPGEAPPVFPQR
jgi:WD40 repeat protein